MVVRTVSSRTQCGESAWDGAWADDCETMRRTSWRADFRAQRSWAWRGVHCAAAVVSTGRKKFSTCRAVRKILIIEDEAEMRRNITTILRLEGFKPIAAENGRVGVELATKEKPDLILCDVMMPELDGYGVIKALHNEPA